MPSDLDFISRPNPVEPSALNNGNLSAHQLDRTTNDQLMPFLLNNRLSQPRRDSPFEIIKASRKTDQPSTGLPIANVLNQGESTKLTPPRPDQALYTLPKLPVKRGTKRNRVPPVLQGLHEPPPTSRILPSISAEETQVLLPSTRPSCSILNDPSIPDKAAQPAAIPGPVDPEPKPAENDSSDKRVIQRNKWTDQETNDLLRGVAKFGIGSWKKILMCPELSFNKRTAVDLKDRFRVCKPNAYGKPRTKKAKRTLQAKASTPAVTETVVESSYDCGTASDGAVVATVRDIDVDENVENDAESVLWKVKRRTRRRFNAEEDAALLRGYEEHGASWQSIQKDPIFQSTGRTPTDLRDRFRTKFPDQYSKAGLVPRPANFPKPMPRTGASASDKAETNTAKDNAAPVQITNKSSPSGPTRNGAGQTQLAHRPQGLPLPRIADDYIPGVSFHDEEDDGDGPIVLDRSIVDWANSTMPSGRSTSYSEPSMLPGIDPLITLKLPKPGNF